jgi:hypothetical protein
MNRDRRLAHSRERLVLGQNVDRANDVGRHDLVACQAVPLQHSLRQTCERQLFLAFGQDAFREGESEGHDLLLVWVSTFPKQRWRGEGGT